MQDAESAVARPRVARSCRAPQARTPAILPLTLHPADHTLPYSPRPRNSTVPENPAILPTVPESLHPADQAAGARAREGHSEQAGGVLRAILQVASLPFFFVY